MTELLQTDAKRRKRAYRPKPPAELAGELMDIGHARLRTSQSLGHALEELCRHGLPELPVVDEEDNLVGTFGAEDALKMCVPEHLLWVDELSGPERLDELGKVLGPEMKRPLGDVMLVGGQSLTVSESTPLGQVARLMVKNTARLAMVLERRELRGVITARKLLARMLGH